MRQLAELLNGLLHLTRELVEHLHAGFLVVDDDVLGQTQVHGQRDQVLLRPVVEVALDPAPFGVPAGDDPRPGLAQGVRLLAHLVQRGLQRGVELGVVEGQPDLARQVGEHTVVVLGERARPSTTAPRRSDPAAPRRG